MPGKACCATSPVAKETSMPRPQPSHRQPDLFWPKDPPVPIAAFDRAKLLPLVSALLAETLAIRASSDRSRLTRSLRGHDRIRRKTRIRLAVSAPDRSDMARRG